jgi:hypothetical protein
MTEHRGGSASYGRDLALPPLPRRHAHFPQWEFDARARVMAASSPDFDASLLIENIKADWPEPWEYSPANGPEASRKYGGFRKLNNQLWAALLQVIKDAIRSEKDNQAMLRWTLFYDTIVKATQQEVVIAPAGEADEHGSGTPQVTRPQMPEFHGQFLWVKMRKHVMSTSRSSKHKAMTEFHNIKLQSGKVLEFLANVEEVAYEAGFGLDQQFLLVKNRLESSSEHKAMFLTWKLINRDSTDLTDLKDYFQDLEADRHDRFKHVPTYNTSRWNTGAAAVEVYDDWQEDWGEAGSYAAAVQDAEDPYAEEDDQDESPGVAWSYGDQIWDCTTNAAASWQEWTATVPAINFATAARFKGRKGKPKNSGFRRFMSKGRAKKGKGQGKGRWTPYGGKGKGAAAPTPEEDDDPTAFYDQNDANPLNHFYWDVEHSMGVYDPDATTEVAAAAMKARKGKGGKKGGKQKKGQSTDTRTPQQVQADKLLPCIKWSYNRCTHGKTCRYSHTAPGGEKGSATQQSSYGKGKGAAASAHGAPHEQQDLSGWHQHPQAPHGYASPDGTEWAAPAASHPQQQLALMPYQPNAAAQQQMNVHPSDRGQVERFITQLHQSRSRQGVGASATPQTSYPSGYSGRDFPH